VMKLIADVGIIGKRTRASQPPDRSLCRKAKDCSLPLHDTEPQLALWT